MRNYCTTMKQLNLAKIRVYKNNMSQNDTDILILRHISNQLEFETIRRPITGQS